jgi:formamidopyrimidine-DNA glycosylase
VRGQAGLGARSGTSLTSGEAAFAARRARSAHAERALTAPRLLWHQQRLLRRNPASRLSPFQRTANLDDQEMSRLHGAARSVLIEWTERLRRERGAGFPEKVTAFRDGMAVHGRYREPCPVCGSPVQRILYAENEANYCATCQTGGRLLADRVLSQLLKGDWPRTLEELESRRASGSNLLPARTSTSPEETPIGAA